VAIQFIVGIAVRVNSVRVLSVPYELQLLEKGNKLVLEQIVTTIATVADAVEEHFVPFYDEFMPSLKFIMANATTKDYRLLRGKTIECISLIGLAVGQEKVGVWQRVGCGEEHGDRSLCSVEVILVGSRRLIGLWMMETNWFVVNIRLEKRADSSMAWQDCRWFYDTANKTLQCLVTCSINTLFFVSLSYVIFCFVDCTCF